MWKVIIFLAYNYVERAYVESCLLLLPGATHLAATPVTEPGVRDIDSTTPPAHCVTLTADWSYNDRGDGQ